MPKKLKLSVVEHHFKENQFLQFLLWCKMEIFEELEKQLKSAFRKPRNANLLQVLI